MVGHCYYAALLPRRGPHYALHSVCPSVCLSVRPIIVTERHVAPPSELQWHTCTFRHALRAAYRTAISAAQILVSIVLVLLMMMIFCCGLNAPDFTQQSLSTVITNTVVVHALMMMTNTDEHILHWMSSSDIIVLLFCCFINTEIQERAMSWDADQSQCGLQDVCTLSSRQIVVGPWCQQ